MMKKYLIFSFVMIAMALQAQIAPDKYFIQFTDKDGSPYTIDNPSAFLTERAIQRRLQQQIAITEQDIPVNPAYLEAVANTGANLLFPTKWLNGVTIETQSQQVLDAIAALPFVSGYRQMKDKPVPQQDKAKLFFEAESMGDHLGDQLKSGRRTGVFDYGSAYTQISQINGIPLHDNGFRGEGMVIALLDGGFSGVETHIAFDSIRNSGQILGVKDFVHPGGNVYTESSHGTAVLSTIAANVPGQMIGTAPKAAFWLLRPEYVVTEHVIEEYNWVSAAEFADSVGVDIINSSLGYIDFDFPQWNHTYDHMNGQTCVATIGADIAADKGILVVNSAGNSGTSSSFPYIGAPADGVKVFSIGAVNGSGVRASFSSIGPTFDGRIKPEVMAMGQGTAVAGGSSGFTFSNGTSFSSPVMAGMAACLWQSKPNFSNMEIKEAIMLSGNNAAQPNSTIGYGIPDMVVAASYLTSIDTGNKPEIPLIAIQPNPFNDEIQIVFRSFRESFTVILFDAMGRKVHSGKYSGLQTQRIRNLLQQLPSGIYMLHVSDNNTRQVTKLVKQ